MKVYHGTNSIFVDSEYPTTTGIGYVFTTTDRDHAVEYAKDWGLNNSTPRIYSTEIDESEIVDYTVESDGHATGNVGIDPMVDGDFFRVEDKDGGYTEIVLRYSPTRWDLEDLDGYTLDPMGYYDPNFYADY